MRLLAFSLLLWSAPVLAQEVRTDPFEMVHPSTGEPGVWIPQWVQRLDLQRREDLRVCQKVAVERSSALEERKLEVQSLRSQQSETQAANERLKEQLTAEAIRRKNADSRADINASIAWASAGGGSVAILVAVLLSVL